MKSMCENSSCISVKSMDLVAPPKPLFSIVFVYHCKKKGVPHNIFMSLFKVVVVFIEEVRVRAFSFFNP